MRMRSPLTARRAKVALQGRMGRRRLRECLWAPLLSLVLLLGAAPRVGAHTRTATFSQVDVTGRHARWDLRVAAPDLLGPLGLPETLPPAEQVRFVQARLADAEAYVGQHLGVRRGDATCSQAPESTNVDGASEPATFGFRFRYTCPDNEGAYRLRYSLFFELDPLASGYVQVALDHAAVATDVFRRTHDELIVVQTPSLSRQMRRFWWLGIEHIFTGYDHLAFLVGLLLVAVVLRDDRGAFKPLGRRTAIAVAAWLVTAFTVAHSLTLLFATVRPDLVPVAWVEAAIALSVALVGLENLLPRPPRRRWLWAFGFGLVHGLGFASILQEVGLPSTGFLPSLLSFNLGVECGQLVVVAALLPVLLWTAGRSPRAYRWLVVATSAALLIAGLIWLVQRLPPSSASAM